MENCLFDWCINNEYEILLKEWHPIRNDKLTAKDFAPKSNKKVWWQCKNGHEWEAVISSRVNQRVNCPYCTHKRVSQDTCLASTNPILTQEWHPNRNEPMTIFNVTSGSGKKAWWKCADGHEWIATIAKRASGQGCPFCSNRRVLAGYNDFLFCFPEIAEEWHPRMNGQLLPSQVTKNSRNAVWWLCRSCGHEWKTSVSHRTLSKTGCPVCSLKTRGESKVRSTIRKSGSLSDVFPSVASEWNFALNGDLSPNEVSSKSEKKIFWITQCGHSWEAKVIDRVSGQGCPYCAGKRVLTGFNDLVTIKPQVASEWNVKKNGALLPENIFANSTKSFWWTCSKCGIDWKASPQSRNQLFCHICHRKSGAKKRVHTLIVKNGSLHKVYPELMMEWNYKKNFLKGIVPDKITHGSGEIVSWVCSTCGNSWETAVSKRTIEKTGCPYCAGKAVSSGFNDLVTQNPQLAAEWHPTKNVCTADMVTVRSGKEVWWKCSICDNEWKSSISNRTAGNNCPKCKGSSTSFPEQCIYFYLSRIFRNVTNRYIEANTKSEIDIYIEDINFGIEYDGFRFHNSVEKLNNDDKKTKALMKIGIPLLRIRESSRQIQTSHLPTLNTSPYALIEYHPITRFSSISKLVKRVLEVLGEYDPSVISKIESLPINVEIDRFQVLHNMYQGRTNNSLATLRPDVAVFWDDKRNSPLKPNEVSSKSSLKVFWICHTCAYEWETSINSQGKSKGCPNCNNLVASEKYNFAYLYPELLKEWNFDKNVDISPDNLMPFSHTHREWKCNKCGFEWKASTAARISGTGCPKCGRDENQKAVYKAVRQFDKETKKFVAEYQSARDAYRKTGVNFKKISLCCHGGCKSAGGYIWKFFESK